MEYSPDGIFTSFTIGDLPKLATATKNPGADGWDATYELIGALPKTKDARARGYIAFHLARNVMPPRLLRSSKLLPAC